MIETIIQQIKEPWHWAVAGLFIGLTVPVLLLIGNKKFGISSSLRHICAICVPSNIQFFRYDWKKELWNLFFVVGVFLGSVIATQFLSNPNTVIIAQSTQSSLSTMGIQDFTHMMPSDIFSFENIFTLKGFVFFILGGFLVGFGTRYAGGCTSGHSIMGLATLQIPSLIATCCFMVGGFFSANVLLPLLFTLL
jgi:uncharacterized membrane protein YedE/YeeE